MKENKKSYFEPISVDDKEHRTNRLTINLTESKNQWISKLTKFYGFKTKAKFIEYLIDTTIENYRAEYRLHSLEVITKMSNNLINGIDHYKSDQVFIVRKESFTLENTAFIRTIIIRNAQYNAQLRIDLMKCVVDKNGEPYSYDKLLELERKPISFESKEYVNRSIEIKLTFACDEINGDNIEELHPSYSFLLKEHDLDNFEDELLPPYSSESVIENITNINSYDNSSIRSEVDVELFLKCYFGDLENIESFIKETSRTPDINCSEDREIEKRQLNYKDFFSLVENFCKQIFESNIKRDRMSIGEALDYYRFYSNEYSVEEEEWLKTINNLEEKQ